MSKGLQQNQWVFKLVAENVRLHAFESSQSLAHKHLAVQVTDWVNSLAKLSYWVIRVNHLENSLLSLLI